MEKAIFIRFKLEPGPTIGNHAGIVSATTVLVLLILEVDARAAYNLIDNDPLCSIDNKRTPLSHQRQLPDKNILLLDLAALPIDQAAGHVHL